MIQATRYHDICAGHRVFGHESKCAHLHGHNYRFHFTVQGELDKVGRVMDFSVIKSRLAMWLEDNWDHKFLLWQKDPLLPTLKAADKHGVISVPFNPTAENIAEYFVEEIAPIQLAGTGATLVELKIEETRKCAAIYKLDNK
jgi:6-pyruvoyltetrahydropterin/6-carboxytetrahydropterin synthase